MMKKNLLFSFLILLPAIACQKPELVIDSVDELVGHWQFVRHELNDGRVYARVPNEDGLNEMQKNGMLRFSAPDQFGEYLWNWCGTPPAIPSGWKTGTWQRRTVTPEILDVVQEGHPLAIHIVDLQQDSLFVRYVF